MAAGTVLPIRSVSHSLGRISTALRQMSQARHVGKIVVTSRPLGSLGSTSFGSDPTGSRSGSQGPYGSTHPCGHTSVSEILSSEGAGDGGCVLVTGGLGALGTLLASWLSGIGVRRIVLASRLGRTPTVITPAVTAASSQSQSQEEPGLQSRLHEALGSDSCVTIVRCDAADPSELQEALMMSPVYDPQSGLQGESVGAGGRLRLSAVFHAGGVLADASIRNQVSTAVITPFPPSHPPPNKLGPRHKYVPTLSTLPTKKQNTISTTPENPLPYSSEHPSYHHLHCHRPSPASELPRPRSSRGSPPSPQWPSWGPGPQM